MARRLDYAGRARRQRKTRSIRVDTRGRYDDMSLTILRGYGYDLDIRGLPCGDWAWDLEERSYFHKQGYEATVIEHKTLADLRDTDRLRDQLGRMTDPVVLYMVLVEYKFDTDQKRRWDDKAILNAELSMQAPGRLVTRCERGGLADRIHEIYLWTQKSKHGLTGEGEEG